MSRFCTVHTHSTHCDGADTLAEMARAAYAAGAVSFGASGHSHTPLAADEGCVLPADMADYRAEVLQLRTEYAGRMDVLLGLELDNCADVAPEGLDYWIASVHNLRGNDGKSYGLDWSAGELDSCCREGFEGNFLIMAGDYYDEVRRMAAMCPTILGHIDLITKFNEKVPRFDEEDPRYRSAALDALHATDPGETLLEINTGAMFRGYRKTPYPALFLLREWRNMGGKIILTSDAHSTAAIVSGYKEAAELARGAGYERSAVLAGGGRIEYPLPG